jgi:hypothetical protein
VRGPLRPVYCWQRAFCPLFKVGRGKFRSDEGVSQANDKGQEEFAKKKAGLFVAGSANPSWGWDDTDDQNKTGDFVMDPANLIRNYFGGLKSFSCEYLHNPYVGLIKP